MNMNWYQKIGHTIHQKKKKPSKKDDNSTTLDVNVNKANWKNNANPRSSNRPRKKALILGDLIVKHVEGWRLNRWMRYTVSVRSGAATRAIKYHPKGCLEDSSPDAIILHHGTNDLKGDNTYKMLHRRYCNRCRQLGSIRKQLKDHSLRFQLDY